MKQQHVSFSIMNNPIHSEIFGLLNNFIKSLFVFYLFQLYDDYRVCHEK